ncbi:MAG: TspO/MBR family protein [Candidatus Absconditabacteria bacterium]
MDTYQQYGDYLKPDWAPPSYLFGIVWPILYILIFISYGFVFYKAFKKEISITFTIPFIINLLSNFTFTYLWFTKGNLLAGFIDIIIVWMTIVITIIISWKKFKRVSYMQIPYLIRVSFASVLAYRIYVNN